MNVQQGAGMKSKFYVPVHIHFQSNPGGSVLMRLDRQVSITRQLSRLFSHDTTYGILTPAPYNPLGLALISWTAWRGWRLLPRLAQDHARIALAINMPLYFLFCDVGELRDLSFLYVTLLLLIAQNLREWNGSTIVREHAWPAGSPLRLFAAGSSSARKEMRTK